MTVLLNLLALLLLAPASRRP